MYFMKRVEKRDFRKYLLIFFLKILSDTLYVKLYQFIHPILFVKMYNIVFFPYIP